MINPTMARNPLLSASGQQRIPLVPSPFEPLPVNRYVCPTWYYGQRRTLIIIEFLDDFNLSVVLWSNVISVNSGAIIHSKYSADCTFNTLPIISPLRPWHTQQIANKNFYHVTGIYAGMNIGRVYESYHNKLSQTRWFQQQKFISPSSRSWKPYVKVAAASICGETSLLWPADSCLLAISSHDIFLCICTLLASLPLLIRTAVLLD